LVDANADINLGEEEGLTPLIVAARKGAIKIVELLVDANADINKAADSGDTALDWAVCQENQECGEYLRSKGATCSEEVYPTAWKQMEE